MIGIEYLRDLIYCPPAGSIWITGFTFRQLPIGRRHYLRVVKEGVIQLPRAEFRDRPGYRDHAPSNPRQALEFAQWVGCLAAPWYGNKSKRKKSHMRSHAKVQIKSLGTL